MSKKISSHQQIVAYAQCFNSDQLQHLYDFVIAPGNSPACDDILHTITDLVQDWNDAELKLDVDWSKPILKDYTGNESMVESMATPDHAIHSGNVNDPSPLKWTAIVMVSNRDEVQGGEMVFRSWAHTPYKDNFGKWIGDIAKPHIPQWLNEQGTVVIFPSMYEHGFSLVTSGTQKRVKIQFAGPQWR